MASVTFGMHNTIVGVRGILGKDVNTRNGKGEDERDYHLSSQSVESSQSVQVHLFSHLVKNCLEGKVKYESPRMIGTKSSRGRSKS